ncbi:fusaric acid resistance protein [Arthrobacter sp. RIT-PI-e]|uniref:FUSC family protein n=1 Tax=Arthrobacter sp. RIT-PI-e TaxID=1681197 RepID=UPI00067669CB|nr:FUSC family protein [Arthrobacter sp. RIT-PI-e]KNC17704.1 fusaric acid resistance protein [Arthrobacter sp. RIT-PI-e]
MTPRQGLSIVLAFVRKRSRIGFRRSSNSLVPALQMTVCAVGAYAFAEVVLGHNGPLFAATSSMISLGFSRDPRLRRVLEVAIGCTLGISVGDLLLTFFGTGLWQAAVVLFISILLARFLDSGTIFTTQLGLQSLLVVLLPIPDGGPFTRSVDAIVGGLFALAVTMLLPRDPRREPKVDVRGLLGELSGVLRECATALRGSDSTLAWHALVRARNCQGQLDSLTGSMRAAQEVATISPVHRRHRGELVSLREAVESIDLAIRNSRVFSRRLTSAINHTALTDDAVENLGHTLEEISDAVLVLGRALSARDPAERRLNLRQARDDLAAVATGLHPDTLHISRLEGEGLVLLLRPLVVDLLEATGLPHEDAAAYLPRL